jgi:ankyrin repeat/BTB/POZ domain-containing protein 1
VTHLNFLGDETLTLRLLQLDVSEEFRKLCESCRIGDLKGCQEAITTGVNINARDLFDYTPLILVSSTFEYERSLLLDVRC